MLKGLRVPTHRVDAPGLYILPWDDAWDVERIRAERDELEAFALSKLQDKAVATMAAELGRELTDEERATALASCVLTEEERADVASRHPFERYVAGETRFDVDAIDQSPRGPVRVLEYVKPGAQPTVFHLRRVGYQARMRIETLSKFAGPIAAWSAWVKAGVERITCGAETLWEATPGERELPDSWMEQIQAASDGGLQQPVMFIAGACDKYSRPLDAAEKGR